MQQMQQRGIFSVFSSSSASLMAFTFIIHALDRFDQFLHSLGINPMTLASLSELYMKSGICIPDMSCFPVQISKHS